MLHLDPSWIPFALLMAHFVGDYWLQSDWMAIEKGKSLWVAGLHGAVYVLPHALVVSSPVALLVIGGTHALIDHYSVGSFMCFWHNRLSPCARWQKEDDVDWTGMSTSRPLAITFLVYVAMDNSLHLIINGLACYFL